MRQALHLLLVNPNRGCASVARHGDGWLLPVVVCPERARAVTLVTRWTGSRGIDASVIGQWLGRAAPEDGLIDWLVVLRVASGTDIADGDLAWQSLDDLVARRGCIAYQDEAVRTSLAHGGLPAVPGPFGNLHWLDSVKCWLRQALNDEPLSIVPYRVSAYEVVLGATAQGRTTFFKGLSYDRAHEARLTRIFGDLVPGRFAHTLALDERPDGTVWWLADACKGRPGRIDAAVAGALAEVQQSLACAAQAMDALRPLDLEAMCDWVVALLATSKARDLIRGHLETLDDAPQTWIPMDIDPSNVIITDEGVVSFIDLDESFKGPAPLSLALLASRARNPSLWAPYQNAWGPVLKNTSWPHATVVARMVDAWLGWRRVACYESRGEVVGLRGVAADRLRERIRTILQGL